MTDLAEPPQRVRPRIALHTQIFIALVCAVLVGALTSEVGWTRTLLPIVDLLGQLFLRLLKMLVVPLIFSTILVGISGVGEHKGVGKLGLWTAVMYLSTSVVAILIGLTMVVTIQPGLVDGQPARQLVGLTEELSSVLSKVQGRDSKDIFAVFLRMVPENVVADAASGEMLGLIFFALVFGMALSRIDEPLRRPVIAFFVGVEQAMLKLTHAVLSISPIGVFALVSKVVMTTGWSAFAPLAWFMVTVLLALSLHACVVVPCVLLVVARSNPLAHFKAMTPALLMAFSTASSSGTLPVTMKGVQKLGVSERVSSFTLPLGSTVNMDGTALYECVAAVFIAQAYGVDLSFYQLLVVVTFALVTSIGVAGIPAASLVAISLILTAIGLPLEGLGLILAVDRILDMCRTTVNVLGDSVVASCVQRLTYKHHEMIVTGDET
jgi:proton glutamate symport protein